MRKTVEIPPEPLDGIKAARKLERYADILMPEAAEAPILVPAVRAALTEWMTEIRIADNLSAVGLQPRRTALLYGPPGCGKTTFAHHFAARLGLPLACVRSESLVDAYLGSTGKNIGQLFDAMKETEGAVVMFFDEVDALGSKRMNDQGASVERSNSLNVLLRRIETFAGICLAATNRQDHLDTALWRRFDMQISIDLPGADERFAILRRYGMPFAFADEAIDVLADATAGASPALLRALMEGLKRALVLWPRLKRRIDDASSVLSAALAAVAPPPGIEAPIIWADPMAVKEVAARLAWPPVIPATEDAAA